MLGPGLGQPGRRHRNRVTGAGLRRGTRMRREHRHSGTPADDLQLVHRGRPLQVTSDQQWRVSLSTQAGGQFAGQCRLPGALQAGEHHDGRRGLRKRQLAGFAAEDAYQFLVDDLDDLLSRVEGAAPRPRGRVL